MKASIQRIKKEIESKRKQKEENLKLLKEKSIIYNIQKEKQKNYFLNKTSSFLSKKRKHSNSDKNNKDKEISNNISNYEDCGDIDYYINDVMNNSFFSNRNLTKLNFCRPEGFSLKKNEKKLSIKNEQEFTINKTIKKKHTLSHGSSLFESGNNIGSQIATNIFGDPTNNSNNTFGNSSNTLFSQNNNKPFSIGIIFCMGKK